MTKQQLEEAYKDTPAYKANKRAKQTTESALLLYEAANKTYKESLFTQFETMWALGATPEYQAWKEAQDD